MLKSHFFQQKAQRNAWFSCKKCSKVTFFSKEFKEMLVFHLKSALLLSKSFQINLKMLKSHFFFFYSIARNQRIRVGRVLGSWFFRIFSRPDWSARIGLGFRPKTFFCCFFGPPNHVTNAMRCNSWCNSKLFQSPILTQKRRFLTESSIREDCRDPKCCASDEIGPNVGGFHLKKSISLESKFLL